MLELVNITAHRPLGTEFVNCQAPAGLSVAQMLWNGPQPDNLPYTLTVYIDGIQVIDRGLDTVYPPAGSLVVVKTLPKGGGGDLFRTVLMIAVVVAATFFG